MNKTLPSASSAEIERARPPKQLVDFERPYAHFVESEYSRGGRVQQVLTVLLTNSECPFRCLMCDLWKHTRDEPTPRGAIARQIEWARRQSSQAEVIKLYNSGNFFDSRAIPRDDHAEIAAGVRDFKRVIVENHPRLCSDRCVEFRDRLSGALEVAMGLETVHPEILPRLNKSMTLDDFSRATAYLLEHAIDVRAFILLRPPLLTESEGVEWALRSIEFAFDQGVECCSVIPTRAGNGIMEQWQDQGWFTPPSLDSLERVLEAGLGLRRGRVFVDTWDATQFASCEACRDARIERLKQMNLQQSVLPRRACPRDCEERGAVV